MEGQAVHCAIVSGVIPFSTLSLHNSTAVYTTEGAPPLGPGGGQASKNPVAWIAVACLYSCLQLWVAAFYPVTHIQSVLQWWLTVAWCQMLLLIRPWGQCRWHWRYDTAWQLWGFLEYQTCCEKQTADSEVGGEWGAANAANKAPGPGFQVGWRYAVEKDVWRRKEGGARSCATTATRSLTVFCAV